MRRLKTVSFVTLAIAATLFVAGWIITSTLDEQVRNLVVKSLNDRLDAKVSVGKISFSLLPAFPYATVTFSDVVVQEPQGFRTTGTVMTAGKVEFHFGLASLFGKSYKLRKLSVSDASFNLQTDGEGRTNYHIWKSNLSGGDTTGFGIELEEVAFTRVHVLYYHVPKMQDIALFLEAGTLSGNFTEQRYALSAEGEFKHGYVTVDRVRYMNDRKGKLNMQLAVDRIDGTYSFSPSWLQLEGLKLAISGTIRESEKTTELDLHIGSPDAGIRELLSVIPERYLPPLREYACSGTVDFSGTVKGISDMRTTPLIRFEFNCHDARLKAPGSPYELKQLKCRGAFSNRKNNANPVTWLKIENLSALLGGKPVNADVEIENLSHPRIAVRASLEAELAAVAAFFLPDTLEDVSGSVFLDARFNGIAGEKSTYRSSGDIRLNEVGFRIKRKPLRFEHLSGTVHLDNNDLVVQSVSGMTGGSDFHVTGTFGNLFAWLLDDGQRLEAVASFRSDKLKLDDWMGSGTGSGFEGLRLSPNLGLHLSLEIREFQFHKFQASEITGDVVLADRVFSTGNIALNTVAGVVNMSGSIDNRSGDSLQIRCDAVVISLDIRRLFYEMGNFGQDVLTERHLRGKVSASIQFRSSWSNQLSVNENSIYARTAITIENGELIRFEPMLALSRYLKGADLQTIRFSTLTNTIEIRNRVIHIPLMEIKSSAADITAFGDHSFDNQVDYHLRLYLSQIMGKKVRSQNTEFGTIEEDGQGRPMMYLTMKGNASDPKFAWDTQGVEQKISTEISNEAKNLKQILKQEFGKKSSEPQVRAQGKKKEELQIDYDESGE